jgi:integrase
MAAVKITKRTVDAAEPRADRYIIFDLEIPGFGLRVFPTGQKTWIFEYRPVDGGRRAAKKRMKLGSALEMTPDKARAIADKKRAVVVTGGDPQGDRAENRKAMTVAELASSFLSDHVAVKRKTRTKDFYEDIVNRMIVPALGTIRAKDLKRSEVAKLHLDWRDTPFQANRILATIGSMYTFGARRGFVDADVNPARHIEKYDEARRERFLSTEELERLGAAIREAETVGIAWDIDPTKKTKHVAKSRQATVIGEHAAAALRLLIFTGARLREILDLKWSEVDIERGLLLLSDSKTGQKAIVLNAPALDVLNRIARIGTYVIAGDSAGQDGEKPRSDLKRPWAVVSRQAGLKGVRIHDLRHTYASFGAGGGLGLPIIGKLLGHSQSATTQRYAHLDNDPLKRAANAIGATIAAAMGDGAQSADVVPFSRGGKP